jgi:hypothetical protein
MYKSKRIFMSEVDASPGNGAPAASPQPAGPNAAPTAPAPEPTITPDQVKSWISEALGGFKNEFFANARRAGLLKKEEPSPRPTPAKQPDAAPAPTGLTAADVQRMLERDRVLTRAEIEHKLTPAQAKRMRALLEAERPDDVSGWVSAFMTDMGLVRTQDQQPPVTPQQPAVQPNTAPVSDKGSPAPGTASSWQRELAERPLSMSAAARAAMDAELGERVARQKRIDAARALHGNTLRVTPK